jgi:ParB/RepB/Spo0J family partition protein
VPTRKRGLQGAPEAARQAGDQHPLAGREGIDETALSIPIGRIKPDPEQPRKQFDEVSLSDLAASITTYGLLQPLIVRAVGDQYYIVTGERRYRAALQAGLSALPCRTLTTGEEVLEIQLVENLQREDLPLMDEALALQRLQTLRGGSVRDLETATGKSKSYISRRLRLLSMPQDVQDMLQQAPQLFSQAESLAKIQNESRRKARIAELLQEDRGDDAPLPPQRAPGRPVKPFSLRKKRTGGFDAIVKYRPGMSDRQSLITELRKILDMLENEKT